MNIWQNNSLVRFLAIIGLCVSSLVGAEKITRDTVGRILQVDHGDGTLTNYNYDENGNRLSRERIDNRLAINVTIDPPSSGTVTGDGPIMAGSAASLSATPAGGFIFHHWSENGVTIGTDSTLTFNVSNFRNLTANFIPVPEIVVEDSTSTPVIELADGGSSLSFTAPSAVLRTLTIRNSGNATLSGISTSLAGAATGNFVIGTLPTSIAPGGSATLAIQFYPSASGTCNATLHIYSNDADESSFAINLAGTANLTTTPGHLDLKFAGTGTVSTSIGGISDLVQSVVVQRDGKIVVAGESNNGFSSDFALVRYNTNGSLDTSFNGSGKVTTHFSGGGLIRSSATSVSLQTDGKIVVAGNAYDNSDNEKLAVARYNSNGSLDTSFNGTGIVTSLTMGGGDGDRGVAIQMDGKIILSGWSFNPSHTPVFSFLRYNVDGTLDTTLGGTGMITTDFGNDNYSFCYNVAVQSDGKIVVEGLNSTGCIVLARYQADGSLDTTFGVSGKIASPFSDSSEGLSMTIQSDGKIVVGGHESSRFAVARYNVNGSLDTTFNSTGVVTTDFGVDSTSYGHGVAVQANGKIVITGFTNVGDSFTGRNYLSLCRYNTDGSIDTTFNENGKVTALIGNSNVGRSLAVQADGQIIVAGYASNESKSSITVLRYNGDPPEPQMAVEFQGAGSSSVVIADSTANVDFGDVALGKSVSFPIIIKNRGNADLKSLGITLDGNNSSMFSITGNPVAPVSGPSGSTSFTVSFTPTSIGSKTAIIHIASNDPSRPLFSFSLTGLSLHSLQSWREAYFGTTSNTGNASDLATPQGDSITNLMKFATAMDPTKSGKTPGELVRNESQMSFTYLRNKAAVSDGVNFIVEWSDSLSADSWSSDSVTQSAQDQGLTEQVTATMPTGSSGHRFVRLRVTRP